MQPVITLTPLNENGVPTSPTIRIYADGRVEGLTGAYSLMNRIPLLVAQARMNEAAAYRNNQAKVDTAAQGQTAALQSDVASSGKIEGAGTPQKPTGTRNEDTNRKVDRIESFFDEMDAVFSKHFGPKFFGALGRDR